MRAWHEGLRGMRHAPSVVVFPGMLLGGGGLALLASSAARAAKESTGFFFGFAGSGAGAPKRAPELDASMPAPSRPAPKLTAPMPAPESAAGASATGMLAASTMGSSGMACVFVASSVSSLPLCAACTLVAAAFSFTSCLFCARRSSSLCAVIWRSMLSSASLLAATSAAIASCWASSAARSALACICLGDRSRADGELPPIPTPAPDMT